MQTKAFHAIQWIAFGFASRKVSHDFLSFFSTDPCSLPSSLNLHKRFCLCDVALESKAAFLSNMTTSIQLPNLCGCAAIHGSRKCWAIHGLPAQSTDPYFEQRNPWIVPIHSLRITYTVFHTKRRNNCVLTVA